MSGPSRIFLLASLLAAPFTIVEGNAQDAPSVIVVRVENGQYAPTLSMTGDVQAQKTNALSFPTGGRAIAVTVDVGDRVRQGDELASIDASQQQASVATAQSALIAARAQLEQASAQHDRIQSLFEQGNATLASLSDAATALHVAQEAVIAGEAQLTAAQKGLEDTVLRAPSDGIVTSRSVDIGQVVQAAQPIFSLAENGARYAVFDVHERALIMMPDQLEIDLRLATDQTKSYQGILREISPGLDPLMGTVRAKVEIGADADDLPLGATIVGTASVQAREAIVLPIETLASSDGRPAVWVVDPVSETVAAREVSIRDVLDGAIVLPLDALPEGTLVVSQGPRSLRAGQAVNVIFGQEP